jgi:hypothetical protein
MMRKLVSIAAVLLSVALLFMLTASVTHAAPATDLCYDDLEIAFIVAAGKALERKDLAPWQREGYMEGLKDRRWAKVRQTVYGPPAFPRGDSTRWEKGCSERVVASNTLREGTYVFCIWHSGKRLLTQLRQVWDTGARWNDPVARAAGHDFWLDWWIPRLGYEGLSGTQARHVAVIENPRPSRSIHWQGKRRIKVRWHPSK